MITLDTNVIIYYTKDESAVVDFVSKLLQKNIDIQISTVTELELFSYPNLLGDEVDKLEQIMKTIVITPLDSRLARLAGAIRRLYKVKLADAAIAATALFTKTTLVTRNIIDFQKIPDLQIQEI